MIGKAKATRLGDILLEKGLIDASQLQQAISEQRRRREGLSHTDKNAMDATCIGEILIDLGFISRQQLKRGLNWQMYLRKMTLVMSLCAPLMTVASGGASAQVSSSSSSSSTRSSPASLMVQAEDYSSMYGVKTEVTKDTGGGLNVGYIETGDWMKYENVVIDVPIASAYKVTYRVSSLSGGGSFALVASDDSAQYDVVQVPKTGNWQTWVDVERSIVLPPGSHKLQLKAITKGFNINWFKIDYKGAALPVVIDAEQYAAMSGVRLENTADTGGGKNVAYIDGGDWISYENLTVDIPKSGSYKITYRVSSLSGGGSFEFHEADGSAKHDVVSVPSTGGWQKWINVERIVNLSEGAHLFGLTALTKGFNLNWIKIEPADGAVSSSSATVSSSSSSSVRSSVGSSSSAPVVSSSSKSSSSAAATSSSAANVGVDVVGPVQLRWSVPAVREDMSNLGIEELGGYEIRYRKSADADFTYISIENPYTTFYEFPWLEGNYLFQIAAFDKNGLYSQFIDLRPGG